ncbi:MAG: peptidylprolyl isomerase [Bacteroidota bacterium]
MAAAACLLVVGCARETPPQGYVARVGAVGLTREELAQAADSIGIPRSTSRAFVDEWVVSELLYQEAQRRGLTEDPAVLRRVEESRRRLAIEALLEREVYSDTGGGLNDEALAAFYKAHAAFFTLKEDVVRASYVMFSDRDAANLFRTRVLRGTAWNDAVDHMRADSLNARSMRAEARRQYFTQGTMYPDELWKLTRTLAIDEVSFVVKAAAGYYVMTVHSVRHAGEAPDFEYIRNDVRDRMLIDRRRARYEQLIAGLRERHTVEVTLGEVDTAVSRGE